MLYLPNIDSADIHHINAENHRLAIIILCGLCIKCLMPIQVKANGVLRG